MKKIDYINTLRSHLTGFSEFDRQEILSDIDEHFSNGISEGKTEDEISSALGDPAIIARQYNQTESDIDDTTPKSTNSNITVANTNPSRNSSAGNIIVLIILNLFLMIWLIPTAFSIIFGFWVASIAVSVSGIVVFIVSLTTTPALGITGVFAGIGLFTLGLLFCIGMFCATRALLKVLVKYIKWNIRFAKGDVQR